MQNVYLSPATKKRKNISLLIKELWKQQKWLTFPKNFKLAYTLSLDELQRREQFNVLFCTLCGLMNEHVLKEKRRRRDFNNVYGVYLPKGSLP